MKPINHGPPTRLVLALGLVAGTWLTLSASMPGVDTFLPADAVATQIATDRVHLAQVDLKPLVVKPPEAETEAEEGEDDPQADGEAVESPVSYSTEQADRGKERYESECEECHGDDLRGGLNGGAPLSGLSFEQKFAEGAPASGLFLFMSTLMPPNAPGRYSAETYADLMAYILQQNGFQPGAPLPSDVDALDYLIVEK